MINILKGTGQTLQQSDHTVLKGAHTIVAGMVINDAAGTADLGASATLLSGFALNNSTDSDVKASGRISILLLDGQSVVETDQVDVANSGNHIPTTIGQVIFAGSDGLIGTDSGGIAIGQYAGSRTNLYVGNVGDGTTVGNEDSNGIKQPMATTLYAVKLFSRPQAS